MSLDLVEEIRILKKTVQGLVNQMSRTLVAGTVMAVKGDKVRLDIGDGDTPVPGPWVRIGGMPSGKGGGGHSVYTKPGIGEPMLLISPGGRIGKASRAIFWGPVDNHPSPGTAEADGFVHVAGDARLEIKPGKLLLQVGEERLELGAGKTRMHTGDFEFVT